MFALMVLLSLGSIQACSAFVRADAVRLRPDPEGRADRPQELDLPRAPRRRAMCVGEGLSTSPVPKVSTLTSG